MKYFWTLSLFLLGSGISLFSYEVLLVYAHPGPQQHFYAFQQALQEKGISSKVCPLGEWEENVSDVSMVITEGGDPLFADVHRLLERKEIRHYVYYDNPEPYVPGGYSEAMSIVLKEKIDGILFANVHLADQKIFHTPTEEIFLETKRIGIGYYPLDSVEKLLRLRDQKKELRNHFFASHFLEDRGQPLLVYIGGANQAYYDIAFPFFYQLLSDPDLKECLFVLQPHPRARDHFNGDEILRVSSYSFLEAIAMADAVLYYQSSTIGGCLLAGIQAIQVAPFPYEDLLIRKKLVCTVNSAELLRASLGELPQSEELLEALGYRENWVNRLLWVVCKKE